MPSHLVPESGWHRGRGRQKCRKTEEGVLYWRPCLEDALFVPFSWCISLNNMSCWSVQAWNEQHAGVCSSHASVPGCYHGAISPCLVGSDCWKGCFWRWTSPRPLHPLMSRLVCSDRRLGRSLVEGRTLYMRMMVMSCSDDLEGPSKRHGAPKKTNDSTDAERLTQRSPVYVCWILAIKVLCQCLYYTQCCLN